MGEGVDEAEGAGVEAEALERVFSGAVALVAEDGVARHLAMDADLVFAPRFEAERQVSVFRRVALDCVVGDRVSAFRRFDHVEALEFE